jgi:hypothetical protein
MPRDCHRTGRKFGVALAMLVLLCCATTMPSAALAKVKLTIDVGWENKFRPGKWTPLFLTLQESEPRQVVVEVYCPTDRRYALNVKQGLTIGPQPVTVPIYVPLSYRLDETTVTVRAADSGRRLEYLIVNDFPVYGNQSGPQAVPVLDPFILISGNSGGERMLQAQLRHQNINTAYIATNRLPITPVGYESMDVLLLNQPDFARFNVEQQGAIATWVRSGGLLVIIPGSDPAPTIGPIAEILPARLGEIQQISLDPSIVKKAGLPARFAKLTGRELREPAPDSKPIPLFDPAGPSAVRRWVGMGQVMILPVDVSNLAFDDSEKGLAFWRSTFKGLIQLPVAVDSNNSNYYGSSEDPRRSIAVRQTLDWIGDVPGAGSFGFSYVAIVLLAMMLIVGPVDWFLLKWMGRQPWTWVTISGWIGLITLGSIFIGHIFKSGEVHYRSASLLDEAGGARVASIDMIGIYSPQTTEYDLEMTPHSWWRASALSNPWGSSDTMLTEIPCHQDYRGNRPLPMLINVWNVRFIEGQELGEEPAMIQAQLAPAAGRSIAGSITNRAPFALKDILIRTRDGVAAIKGTIEPGATMQVSGPLVTDKTLASTTQMSNNEAWGLYSQEVPTTRPSPQSINGVGDLRAMRIDQQLNDRDDVACIYATYEAAPGERVKLANVQEPREAHVGVIRALVTMQKSAAAAK